MKLTPICLVVLATQSSVSVGNVIDYDRLFGIMETEESFEGTEWGANGMDLVGDYDFVEQFDDIALGVYPMVVDENTASIDLEAKSISVSSSLFSSSRFSGDRDGVYWESVATSVSLFTNVGFNLVDDTVFALTTVFSASSGTGSFDIMRTDDGTILYSGSSAAGTVNTDMEIELGAGSYFFRLNQTVSTDHVYDTDVERNDDSYLSGSLRVVPAPGSLALLMGGGLVVGRRRR